MANVRKNDLVGIDINDFKEIEQRFNQACNQVGIHTWTIDIPTKNARCLNRWDDMDEIELDVDFSKVEDLRKYAVSNILVAQEDAEKFARMFERLWNGESNIKEQFRQRTPKNKTYTWHEYTSTIVEYKDGKPKTAIGTVRDISAEKKIESRYREELENRSVMEQTVISFCRFNLTKGIPEDVILYGKSALMESRNIDGVFIDYINVVFTEISLTDAECFEVSIPELIRKYNDGISKTSISFWAKSKYSGNRVYVQADYRVVKQQETGELIGFFYNRDITEKKLQEEFLTHLSKHSYERSAALFVKEKKLYRIFEIAESNLDYFENCDYDTGIMQYCAKELPAKDATTACKALFLDTVVNALKEQEEYSVEYDIQDQEGKYHRKRVEFSYIDKENGIIMLTKSDIALYQQLKFLSEHDPLTGLKNRKKFFEDTAEMIRSNPEKTYFFMHCDIDRFKLYNSAFGDKEGDRLLQFVAQLMSSTAASYECCVSGRLQSDVFYLCGVYDISILKKNLKYVNEEIRNFRHDYMLQLTFGLYIMEDKTVSLEEAVTRAAIAAQECKGDVNRNYNIYDEGELKQRKQEQEITNEMHHALLEHQFKVFLQPKYDLTTGKAFGAEALVRWLHPQKGIISPGVFIPLFESNGFIANLDQYMWEQVCVLLKKWIDAGYTPAPISVNISRISLYNPNLVEILQKLVNKYQLSPHLLHLEITESAYMSNQTMMEETIDKLHEAGFVILMDDFGSGYSSLNTLKDFHIDILKIDMKFLPESKNTKRAEIILASMIHMAKWLDMEVIMEGVETEEQNTFLKGTGCNYIQGYFYARPMPAQEYESKYIQIDDLPVDTITDEEMESLPKIVAIDDDKMEHDIIKKMLSASYKITCFDAAEPALSYMRANCKKVKLIIADNYLPGINGVDLFEICSQDDDLRLIPKILVTGDDSETSRLLAVKHGADDFLVKPLSHNLLNAYVHKWLQLSETFMERAMGDTLDYLDAAAAVFEYQDETLRLIFANKTALALTGYTKNQLEGRTHEELLFGTIHPEDGAIVSEMVQRVIETGTCDAVYRVKNVATNRYQWLQAHGKLVKAGITPKVYFTFANVTVQQEVLEKAELLTEFRTAHKEQFWKRT